MQTIFDQTASIEEPEAASSPVLRIISWLLCGILAIGSTWLLLSPDPQPSRVVRVVIESR